MMARAFSFDTPQRLLVALRERWSNQRLISQISVKPVPGSQAKQLSFHLITVWPHKKLESNVFVCTKCRGSLHNQPLDVISPLWGNVYSSTTQRWDKGSLLQSHLVEFYRLLLVLIAVIKMQGCESMSCYPFLV